MKFCLIGKKLGHSYSEKIHRSMGLDYSLVELGESELRDFAKNCEYDGFNVTIPYKKDIMPFLDEISEEAAKVGAVNTVKRVNGKLYGYNTDFGGLKYTAERKGINFENENVVVLGSGGAAATAIALSKTLRAKSVTIVGRNGEYNYRNYGLLKDTGILINASPVGMYPNNGECLVDLKEFPKLSAVIDCVYNPYKTELLSRAEEANAIAAGGLHMLVEQALLAEDIWLDGRHDAGVTERKVNEIKAETLNLVLSGMPSSGKSTLGKIVADITGRAFYDADEYVYKLFKRKPKDIISADGEEAFRDMETAAVKELSKLSGAVIALGGGSVLRKENVKELKSNGVIIYVERDLDKLSADGRPVSAAIGVENLYKIRKPVYESTADGKIKNAGDLHETAKEILKAYETACYKRG